MFWGITALDGVKQWLTNAYLLWEGKGKGTGVWWTVFECVIILGACVGEFMGWRWLDWLEAGGKKNYDSAIEAAKRSEREADVEKGAGEKDPVFQET